LTLDDLEGQYALLWLNSCEEVKVAIDIDH